MRGNNIETAAARVEALDFCSCGRIVKGNGAKHQHREMHRRRADGHHYIGYELCCARLTCDRCGCKYPFHNVMDCGGAWQGGLDTKGNEGEV